ncbi:MAG: heavy-metal-associated domain-containing protein [Treponema succinifaciens]|nr:MAG: heavy-metal-associated domain-containing protein [Treponema succinifaciens]
MKCSECAKKLWNSLNKIEELSVKKVNFKNGTAVLEASRNISDEEIKSAVENAGYKFIKKLFHNKKEISFLDFVCKQWRFEWKNFLFQE